MEERAIIDLAKGRRVGVRDQAMFSVAQGHALLCLGQAGLPEVGGMSGSGLVRRAVRDFGTLRIPSE